MLKQYIIQVIDKRELAKALKNCGEEITEKAYRNMSSRAKQDLKNDVENKDIVSENEIADSREIFLKEVRYMLRSGVKCFCQE